MADPVQITCGEPTSTSITLILQHLTGILQFIASMYTIVPYIRHLYAA